MTKNEIGYVVAFLRDLCDKYGNDGCNDLSLPDTPENRKLVKEAMPGEEPDAGEGRVYTYNHVLAGYLANELMRGNGLTEADVPSL